jgi:hypothetical protein
VLLTAAERTPVFCYGCYFKDIAIVEKLFERVYSLTVKPGVSQITSVLGILVFLLKEFAATQDSHWKGHDIQSYLQLCQRNFRTGIQKFEIWTMPSYESVLTLLFAVCSQTLNQQDYSTSKHHRC